ncbi:MAG TPA: alginate lyase family protein [Pyrinomonadaceae bacterium]|jgi:hypothetical protein
MWSKIQKLRGRKPAEFKVRGQQMVSAFTERIGWSELTKLPGDAEFLDKFTAAAELDSDESLLRYYRKVSGRRFYPSFEAPETTVGVWRERFPHDQRPVIERADRIRRGYFDLLGYENLYFENEIPNWHFDPISKKTAPRIHWSKIEEVNSALTGDKKIIWELNRHQYFTDLGRAYWLTKDERYAQTFVAHLENWFAENPPKIGVNWLSSLELAFRAISWWWAFNYFKDSPSLGAPTFMRMMKHLYLHGRHLETYLSTFFSPNTHLTGEALALYFLGTFLPELGAARRWKQTGYEILLDALDFQVRADGVYCEQSSHYHRYTCDFYSNLLILRSLNEEAPADKHLQKLNELFDFLLHITAPDGRTPLIGDDDGGRFYFLDERAITDFRPTLALGAALLGRGDLKFVSEAPSAELLWLLGRDGLGKYDEMPAEPPAENSKAFSSGGFFVARSSWEPDASYVLIDCGEHGFLNCGHAHADALSFVFAFEGETVLTDSGTYNYTSDQESRQYFRSSGAHNCLTVNGRSSSVPAGAFTWRSVAAASLIEWRENAAGGCLFRGAHDGFRDLGVDYEREISLQSDKTLILRDTVASEQSCSYELNFILSANARAEINDDSVKIFYRKNDRPAALQIVTALEADAGAAGAAGWRIEPCFISSRYGSKVQSSKIIFSVAAKGRLKISNFFTKAVI